MAAFAESYLGQLRAVIGSRLVLMPGAQVVVMDAEGFVLMQRRTDSGDWEFPSGAAEPGQAFTDIAIAELAEEAGIDARPDQLEPFATLSDPAVATLRYPNGHEVQAFALCYLLRMTVRPPARGGDGEASEHSWWSPSAPPAPLDKTAGAVLVRLQAFLRQKNFQNG